MHFFIIFQPDQLDVFCFFLRSICWGVRFAAPRNRPRSTTPWSCIRFFVFSSVTPGCPNYFPSPSCALGEQRRLIPHREKHINRAGVFGAVSFFCCFFFFHMGKFSQSAAFCACFFWGVFKRNAQKTQKEN